MSTFVSLSGVNQFWKSKVKEALTAAILLSYFLSLLSAARAEQKGHFISSSENKVLSSLPELLHYPWQKSRFFLSSLLEGSVMLPSYSGFVSQLFLFFLACLACYAMGRRSSAKG